MTNNDLLIELSEIQREFGFKENFNLYGAFQEILKYSDIYKNKHTEMKATRSSKIKKLLNKIHIPLTKVINLLATLSIQVLIKLEPSFFIDEQKFIKKMIDEDLPHLKKLIELTISKLNDTGRLPYSKNQFLIFHLLRIFVLGTKKDIQCNWNNFSRTGKGEAYKFIVRSKELLPKINPQLILAITDRQIVEDINKLCSQYERFEIFNVTKT